MEQKEMFKKLDVLGMIAEAFNQEKITWAVGGSLLLYLKGLAADFHDIDLFVTDDDIPQVKDTLMRLGHLHKSKVDPNYASRFFLEYDIEGVEIDIMAGFTVVDQGQKYDFSLEKNQITDRYNLQGVSIPLQDLKIWIDCYTHMHRPEKAEAIRNYLNP